MAASAWLQAGVLFALVLAATPLVGGYLAKVHPAAGAQGVTAPATAPGDRLFGPVERLVYRVCGVDPRREQRWTV